MRRLNDQMTRSASTPSDNASPTPATGAKKRTRGPNKPKVPDVSITVTTEASIKQPAIVKLLTDFVTAKLGAEAAGGMELQIDGVEGWTPLTVSQIRFATKGSK
jgi:hypothetical protein